MMVNGPTPYSTAYIPLNDTEYEFSPFEFGSHDAPLNAFINITHMGTRLTNGQPDNSTACVQGFQVRLARPVLGYCSRRLAQSFGFVIGTSSSLFNAIVATANSTLGQAESAILGGLTQRITGGLRDSRNDVLDADLPLACSC
jgi:lysophospholipase